MIRWITILLLFTVSLDAAPIPGVTGGGPQGRRTRAFVPPPASGTAPTQQVTYAADYEPDPELWIQDTYDYVIATDGIALSEATDWATETVYVVDDLVQEFTGDYYQCTTDHTSGTGTLQDDIANWTQVFADGTLTWPFDLQECLDGTVSITQNVGAPTVVVIRGGTYVYPLRGDGYDGFEYIIDGQDPPDDWLRSTSYSVGDQVRAPNHLDPTNDSYSPHFWECTSAHTSGLGTLEDDIANWKYAHVPDHYILFRNYNGEQVYIDGGMPAPSGGDEESGPEYIMFWGLNHYNAEFTVDWDTDGNPDTSMTAEGARWLDWEGTNDSFPTNIPHDGDVTTGTGRELRHVNSQAWAIGFGHGGTASEGNYYHGNIVYDQGWVTESRNHGPAFYQRNGHLENQITEPVKETWIENNIMVENYSLQLQIYGSSGVPIEMFRVLRNFARKCPHGTQENFLIGGSRNTPHWNYPIYVNENVVYDCDISLGQVSGGKWMEAHDNWIFSKPGEPDRGLDHGEYDTINETGTMDDPSGIYVFLAENHFDYGRANLRITQTGTPVSPILVDLDEVLVTGDQYAIYQAAAYDPLNQTAIKTGTYTTGEAVAVPVTERDELYVVICTSDPTL